MPSIAAACALLIAGCEEDGSDEDYWFGSSGTVMLTLILGDDGNARLRVDAGEEIPGTYREEEDRLVARFPREGGVIALDMAVSDHTMSGTMIDVDGRRRSLTLSRPDVEAGDVGNVGVLHGDYVASDVLVGVDG